MRLFINFVLLFVIVQLTKSAPDPCSLDLNESSCDQTEYEAYKECIHNESKNEVRKRRQAPCPENNVESLISIKENCQRANFDCRIKCGEDENCQGQCPVCPLNVDELIAASTNNSKENHLTIIFENDKNVDKLIHTVNTTTTVIRLTNIINTTGSFSDASLVDDGNYSIVNETGGEFGLGFNGNFSCCYVVHPRMCTSTSNGPRCHHRREKICTKLCTAKVIHAQEREHCSKKNGCHKKMAYVPQPKPPKCVHIRQWPYVSCGKSYSSNCDGCYDHYGYGYDENDENDKDCEGCFDDAFEYGPRYRRGPVLRPYFYHVPPCYIMGICYPYPFDCGYGCFDHQLIDPSWGYHHDVDEELDFEDDEIDLEDSSPSNSTATNSNNEMEGEADDWAIEIHKCKVVSDNGTIEIRNCTSEDIAENPFAGAPSDINYNMEEEDDELLDEAVRSRRHIHHRRRFHHPQVAYYRVPVLESYNNYDEDDSEYDYHEAPKWHKARKSKSRQRKTSFVYDDEDEN